MGAIRGVLMGLVFWAILGLIWLLGGGCAPIIQVHPCECPQVERELGDYPDNQDWEFWYPTCPPREVNR